MAQNSPTWDRHPTSTPTTEYPPITIGWIEDDRKRMLNQFLRPNKAASISICNYDFTCMAITMDVENGWRSLGILMISAVVVVIVAGDNDSQLLGNHGSICTGD